MIQPFNSTFLAPSKQFRRFSVLLAIYNSSSISQHKIGRITHLSSSMVNNYVKELQEEGLIKVIGDTNRNHSYHITPLGHDELISSLIGYSAEIIQLYGSAKRELSKRLLQIYSEGIRTVILFGAAETAEVVYAAIKDTPLNVTAVVDSDSSKQGQAFNGLFIQKPEELKDIEADAVLITSFARQEDIHECILELFGKKIIVMKLTDL